MIPKRNKPTRRDLITKHRKKIGYNMISFRCDKGEELSNLFEKTRSMLGVTKSSLVKQAIIHYCIFVNSHLKENEKQKKRKHN